MDLTLELTPSLVPLCLHRIDVYAEQAEVGDFQ